VLRSDDPDQWSVAVKNHQGRSWSSFDGGMAEFLVAIIGGQHPNPFAAAGFPSRRPLYRNWRDENS
jgi:hypothetical protein